MYICELTAIDDAGNTSFAVKYLLTFDPVNRCVKLQKCVWQTELQVDREFVAVLLNHGDKDGNCI